MCINSGDESRKIYRDNKFCNMAHGVPDEPVGKVEEKRPKAPVGSRRIFPPQFKLQVSGRVEYYFTYDKKLFNCSLNKQRTIQFFRILRGRHRCRSSFGFRAKTNKNITRCFRARPLLRYYCYRHYCPCCSSTKIIYFIVRSVHDLYCRVNRTLLVSRVRYYTY